MTEAETMEQLVEFTNIVLAGVSVFFTIVSAYVAALNYFIGSATFIARFLAFLFVSVVLAMLVATMVGAQLLHDGLIARLRELEGLGEITAAGRAALSNSSADLIEGGIGVYSVDQLVQIASWGTIGLIYLVLFYLTFLHKWRPDVIPIQLQERTR